MDRLAPEDVQAIVSGVVNNPQLEAGIAAQLKEAIQPPAPVVTPTVTDPPTAPLTDGTQQSGQQLVWRCQTLGLDHRRRAR